MNMNLANAGERQSIGLGHHKALEWIKGGPKQLLIDGKWVNAQSGKTFTTYNPATEEALTTVADADEADVDAAVAAARRAFVAPSWASMTPDQRTVALLKIADAIEEHGEELAALETLDNGMPLWYSTNTVKKCAEVVRYYAGWPTKILGTTNPSDPSSFIYMVREPVGVCGLINAWNTPLMMACMKVANALACGNTAVVKPAELTPLSTLRFGEIVQETGLPPGVVNILPGPGAVAGAALAAHPDVDKVAFTGSTAVGKQILAASTGNLKKITLELGGKSPNIIFQDADLDSAVAAAVRSFCGNSGQICSAGTRLFVHESIHDEVARRVSELAATYKVGSPFDADTKLGPLISQDQLHRVMSYVDAGTTDGADLLLGGSRVGDVGHFIQPTVFGSVSNSMRIAREEIFGPVLSIIPFSDEQDAIAKANDTPYGLAAAVWTRDLTRAHAISRAIKAGRVWVNTYGEAHPVMASGGYKQSGLGREFGAESLEAYTQTKAVLVRL
ncbi:aldehyde dehydrogenase family protein [Paraburkholderia sp. HD33-4]|uniref:aldehyde dehydrogenase family protein n=1 Tax=Paraburkholderia sp. HD33-4 TaxID=2883242 RepID=UPI001F2B278E|nr:aldehyde dehydrogenase family protein [Paraburkholderia sp. HD33-4]